MPVREDQFAVPTYPFQVVQEGHLDPNALNPEELTKGIIAINLRQQDVQVTPEGTFVLNPDGVTKLPAGIILQLSHPDHEDGQPATPTTHYVGADQQLHLLQEDTDGRLPAVVNARLTELERQIAYRRQLKPEPTVVQMERARRTNAHFEISDVAPEKTRMEMLVATAKAVAESRRVSLFTKLGHTLVTAMVSINPWKTPTTRGRHWAPKTDKIKFA